jgi:hypothetical protein
MFIGIALSPVAQAVQLMLSPALFLDFRTGVLDNRITFTRADPTTCATFTGSDGVLRTAAANVPRFDCDPATLLPRGLLIEETRQQLLSSQNALNSAPWLTSGCTVTGGVADPAGGNGAFTWTATATNGELYQSKTVTAGQSFVSAVWIRRRTGTGGVRISCDGTAFTYVTGQVSSTWSRVPLVQTVAGTTAYFDIKMDTAGDAFDLFLPTLEVGAGVLSTIVGAATRAADVDSRTAVLPGASGTVVVEATAAAFNGSQFLWNADDGTLSNRIVLYRNSSGYMVAQWIVGGVSQALLTSVLPVANGVTFKVAIAWASNDFALSLNGAAVVAAASGSIPTVTTVRLGMNTNSANLWNSAIRRATEYSTRLPNATLQALST